MGPRLSRSFGNIRGLETAAPKGAAVSIGTGVSAARISLSQVGI
jgi:hypothetical protein